MVLSSENILLIGSLLLLVSVIAGKTSYKFGVPTLLLFLAIGMLAGSEGIAGITFDSPKVAQFIGVVSLNFILFSGGLDTNWKSVRPILKEGIALSTFGVLLTAVSLGVFINFVTNFTIYESLLLGAIVSSTDAAAVFSILRAKNLALKNNLRPTLELESGSNDPMAYVLTIAFLSLVMQPEQGILSVIPTFLQQMILGGALGLGFGILGKNIINRIQLDFEGLYPVLAIALMFLTFSGTEFVGGNGFLAIYICAVYIGNQDIIHKKTILRMYDGLAWLMQIVLFLTLGLLVTPSEILPMLGIGLIIALALIFLARPIGVFICLLPFRMEIQRRLYISWVGLRGAVPIVFAMYPLLEGIPVAKDIFNIVFIVSVTSVVVQGTTLSVVAKWFKVALPQEKKRLSATDMLLQENPKTEIKEITITPNSFPANKKIVELGFPSNAIIAMIRRDGSYITPNGSTVIESGDVLIVLADRPAVFVQVFETLHIKEQV